MRGLIVVGVLLIVLGVVGLLKGGVSYTKNKETADLGPVDISVEEKEKVAISPVVSVVALAGGIILLVMGATRKRGA